MAKFAESVALYKSQLSIKDSLVSSMLAGIFVGIAFIGYISVVAGSPVHSASVKILGGIVFSFGLTLIMVFGSDLFTSTTLNVVPLMSRKMQWGTLLSHWIRVYVGNIIGAAFIAFLIYAAKQHMAYQGQWGYFVLNLAKYKLSHTMGEAIALGVLANMLVCLAAWISYAGHTLLEKLLAVVLPIALFVSCGFEHSIANLFLFPLSLGIRYFASDTFWQLIGTNSAAFSVITLKNFLLLNLVPVTLGNILGGTVLVGIPQWWLHLRTSRT